LSGQLSSLETQNLSLAETVAQQNHEMDTLVGNLETVIRDLEAAAALAQGSDTQGLSQETRNMANELHAAKQPS
jgi:predicted AAA+ superfamily ATPase